ncbi:unnamed protein product, partial [Brenthis ino]
MVLLFKLAQRGGVGRAVTWSSGRRRGRAARALGRAGGRGIPLPAAGRSAMRAVAWSSAPAAAALASRARSAPAPSRSPR